MPEYELHLPHNIEPGHYHVTVEATGVVNGGVRLTFAKEGDDTPTSFADIQEDRRRGREAAIMDQEFLGEVPHYLVIGYEVYPNGTTSDPVEDRQVADEIGRRFGLGPTTDVAGFAIWTEDRPLAWVTVREWVKSQLAAAPIGFVRSFYEGVRNVMTRAAEEKYDDQPG